MNIGNGSPVNLMSFIEVMEDAIGKKAKKILMSMQPGDVKQTWANTNKLEKTSNYKPKVDISEGVKQFVKWYVSYYK
jgi:UDP-glucuronate 4-epimerase